MLLDILIEGAEVFDGEGGEGKRTSVGIVGDRIAYIGPALGAQAAKVWVNGKGCLLSPGFIDSHASTGLNYLREHAADHKIYQGVTLELIGNCGTSTAPIGPRLQATMEQKAEQIGFAFNWSSLRSYFEQVESVGLPINLATLVGHSTLRAGFLEHWKDPKSHEFQAMCSALKEGMQQGALGFSTGLIYPPGCFADTQELIELATIVKNMGGFYASHIRDERTEVVNAVEEALLIGRASGIPVLISHLKAADKHNWGKVPLLLKMIEDYQTETHNRAAVDVYPYTAVSTKLRAFFPKELLQDGLEAITEKLRQESCRTQSHQWFRHRQIDFASMWVLSDDDNNGRSLVDIATLQNCLPEEAACRLVEEHHDTWIIYDCISEQDMDAAILWKDSMICSDSWSYPVNAKTTIGKPHPRTFGAFSRFLERYVFQTPRLSYGDAIRKITSIPADFLGIPHRGRIRKGHFADLLLMNPNTFADRATYKDPMQYSEGVEFLWINGRPVVEHGELNHDKHGRVIVPEQLHHHS
ncbi:MAG: hypothetical protein EP343_10280 [Deltaproteobacteria bacterium]|nr:MAG: hypothetical protein EP343_10280 [Deltaproteobacteria bacterium]